MENNCIFCKIIKKELPSYEIYENEFFKVILDRFPGNIGHMILVSKTHAADIFSLPDKYVREAMPLAKKAAVALKIATGCEGVNILQNNGEAAGQTVSHFHIHILPRFKDDGVDMTWRHLEQTDAEFIGTAGRIKEVFTI